MASVYFLLAIAIFVIFMILGILYESYIHPITIISGLPSAAIGGLLTLTIFGKDLDLFGIVGVIMLIGIVKKNAIMVVDFALEAEEKENLSPSEAAMKGSLERFRPIMMTTIAAIAGAMPIALGLGAGTGPSAHGSCNCGRSDSLTGSNPLPDPRLLHLYGFVPEVVL